MSGLKGIYHLSHLMYYGGIVSNALFNRDLLFYKKKLLDGDAGNLCIYNTLMSGEACAISTSSVSIMIKNLIGKRVEEALKFIENFESMINEEEYDQDLLKEANAYNEIYKQSNRKNCAYLPYKGIKKVLTEYLKKDTN